jgi:hypothetical protein
VAKDLGGVVAEGDVFPWATRLFFRAWPAWHTDMGILVARAGIKPATIKFTDARQHGQDPVVFDGPNVIKCVYQELCVFILFIFP